ncbi:hypothetical protein ACLOJK_008331 [Asimina triloba]
MEFNRRSGKAPAETTESSNRDQERAKQEILQKFGKSPPGFTTLADLQARRQQEEESMRKRKSEFTESKSSRFCKFGKTVLPILAQNDPTGYRPLTNMSVDTQQKCLLDAIWRQGTTSQKLNACCSLQWYFHKIMQPPLGKNFSFYALCTGKNKGIYAYYSSLMKAIGLEKDHQYRGFYSFAEALDYLYTQIKNPKETIFIEEEPREGPMMEQLQQTIREMTEEIGNMCTEIRRLKALANEFERQQKQEHESDDESTQDSTARSTARFK